MSFILVSNLHYPSCGADQNRSREHGTVRTRDGRGRAHRSLITVDNPARKSSESEDGIL